MPDLRTGCGRAGTTPCWNAAPGEVIWVDEEVALISKMVQSGDVDEVVAAGIEDRHFAEGDTREIFRFCVEHTSLWKTPPSPELVASKFPGFRFRPVPDALGYVAREFIGMVDHREAVESWRSLADRIDDPANRGRLAEVFAEHARDLAQVVPIRRVSRFSDMADRIVIARKEQNLGLSPGISLGYPLVDHYVKGVRVTEYVAFIAWQGVGKSTGLVRGAFHSYLQSLNCMFVSLEMEDMEVTEMFDTMATGLSEQAMRARELKPDDYEAWERAAERAKNASNEIIVIDDTEGAPTVDRLAALVERYKPDILCVDYVSLMEAHRDFAGKDWERVTNISRALKRLARTFRIRVFAAAQCSREAEREGPTLDNIAYSTAIGQDANIVIGFHQTPEMERAMKMEVKLLKARKGPKGNYMEMWNRDRMRFETWSRQHDFELRLREEAATSGS